MSTRPPPRGAVPLVGRTGELAAIERALTSGERLLWIVGGAGVGKTRVAAEAGYAHSVATGARFVAPRLDDCDSLDALTDAVLGASRTHAAARAAGLGAALAEIGPVILVLDPLDRAEWPSENGSGRNAELEPNVKTERQTALFDAWLDAAPELSIVAVARARPQTVSPVFEIDALDSDRAAELFLAYGSISRPGLAVTSDEDRAALSRIVSELDALPLALELAAARLGVMSLPALAHRIGNRWELLRREGTGRHSTLESAISWSLDLLPRWAMDTLAACTIFRGGFSLDAAEAVLGPSMPRDAPPLVDALARLRSEALVGALEPASLPGEVRLSLKHGVRLLAERRLAPEVLAELEERHATSFASAAERWAREVELRGAPEARAALELERENLVAVVERILGRTQVSARAADRALRVLSAIGPVLVREGASRQLEGHLETALAVAQGSGADPVLQARALALRGPLRHARGLAVEGDRDLAEALVLVNHAGERTLEGRISLLCATLAARDGRLDAARLGVERALSIAESTRDAGLRAHALGARGAQAIAEGDLSNARAALEEALALSVVQGDEALRASAARRLGRLELRVGALDAAAPLFEQARMSAVALHDARGEALALCGEGITRSAGGDAEGSVGALEAALAVARRTPRPAVLAAARALAGVAHAGVGGRGEARALLTEAIRAPELDAELRVISLVALARLEHAGARLVEAGGLCAEAKTTVERVPCPSEDLRALLADPLAEAGSTMGDALPRFARRVPVRVTASARPAARRSLVVEEGGRAFTLDFAARVDLSKRRPLRLLLAALADGHARGVARSWDDLLLSGWPGEKMRADAGAHRVRVAVSTLRKLGLAPVIETAEDGYRLAQDLTVRRS